MKKVVSLFLCVIFILSLSVVSFAATNSEEFECLSIEQISPRRAGECPESGTGLHNFKREERRDPNTGKLNAYYYECTKCGENYYHWL